MGRTPTRQLTWQFVLRTFKRVDIISRRYSSEAIAKALVERGVEIGCSPEYLSDIAEYMRKFQREAGVDPYAHPNGNCPQCGHDIDRNHNGARYCSTRCRQRAYRVRKAQATGRNTPIPKRPRTRTITLAGGVYELHLKKPGRIKKRSAGPQSDTSDHVGSETNVTGGPRDRRSMGRGEAPR
jgi:hypothetical protein